MADAPLALVTGGCRRLGAAIAAALARDGWALALHASHATDPEPALAAALAETGVEWAGFVADFADLAAAEALVGRATERFGRAPRLLVNNASTFGDDVLASVSAASLQTHFAVNCAAPALLTKTFAAADAVTGRSVVNILDQRIDHPNGDQFAYTLSKQALAGLTRTSARALAPHVRVNAVAPGLTLPTDAYAPAQVARLAAAMPLAALPAPDQVAAAVLYLARAEATTGQVIYVDGGAHLDSYARDFIYLAREEPAVSIPS